MGEIHVFWNGRVVSSVAGCLSQKAGDVHHSVRTINPGGLLNGIIDLQIFFEDPGDF